MKERGPEQERFNFEGEGEGEETDREFWKKVGEKIDEDIYCKICEDQEGGCPQCGFGRGRKESEEKAA